MATETTVLSIDYIVKTPGVCGGAPRVDGTRISVDWIAGQMVYAGRSLDDMLADYAHIPLTAAQIHAALAYYYDHQREIDGLIEEGEQLLDEVRGQSAQVEDRYISAREAAEIIGVEHESRQVASLCREGKLICRKVANRWLVSRSSAEQYARSERKPGPKAS